MRLIFGRDNLQKATISIMKKKLVYISLQRFLGQVRNELFSAPYQERRCLANRTGGYQSKVNALNENADDA